MCTVGDMLWTKVLYFLHSTWEQFGYWNQCLKLLSHSVSAVNTRGGLELQLFGVTESAECWWLTPLLCKDKKPQKLFSQAICGDLYLVAWLCSRTFLLFNAQARGRECKRPQPTSDIRYDIDYVSMKKRVTGYKMACKSSGTVKRQT